MYFNLPNLAIGEIVLTDDTGTILRLEKPAEKVISLAPNITELIFAAGGKGKLIGVVEGSDYPPEALSIKTIGTFNRINLEQIITLKPDLIIAWSQATKKTVVERLQKIGLKVFLLNPTKIYHIPESLETIGKLLGVKRQAQKTANEFKSQLTKIKLSKPAYPLKVFVQIWNKPLISLNHKDLYSDIIQHCGGINIFTKARFIAPIVNLEQVIKLNPDIILLSTKEKNQSQWKKYWQSWANLKAVQNNKIFFIDPDLTHRATPRIIDGIKSICIALGNP